MATLYQGYAQQRGFGANLVNIPDPAKKIREQGLRAMQGMEKQIDWSNKQAARVTQALEENIQHDAQQSEENYQITQMQRQAIASQKWDNFESTIKQQESNRKAYEKNIKDILALTKTGTQLWRQYDANQKEKADVFARELLRDTGIGLKQYNSIRALTDQQWKDDAYRNQFLRAAGLDGVSNEKLNYIRNLGGGYRLTGIKIHAARMFAQSTEAYYRSNVDTPVNIAGLNVPITLASANAEQALLVTNALDKKRLEDMLPENRPGAKILALAKAQPIFDQAKTTILKQKGLDEGSKNHTDRGLRVLQVYQANLSQELATDPDRLGKALIRTIEGEAGADRATPEDYRAATRLVFDSLQASVSNGSLNPNDILGAAEYVFEHSSGKVSVQKIFRKHWRLLEDAALEGANRNDAVAAVGQIQNRAEDRKLLTEMQSYTMDPAKSPTAEQWGSFLQHAQKNRLTNSITFAQNQLASGQNNGGDIEGLAAIEDMVRRNKHVTPEMVYSFRLSAEGQVKAFAIIRENSTFVPEHGGNAKTLTDALNKILSNEIPEKLSSKEGGNDWSRPFAQAELERRAREQYKIGRMQQNMSHQEALQHALKFAQEMVDKDPYFKKEIDKRTGNYHFKGAVAGGSSGEPIELDYTRVSNELAADPESVYNKSYIPVEDLHRKAQSLQRGEAQKLMPRSIFLQAVSKGSMTALDIEMAQIEHYNQIAKEAGQPLIPQYPDWYVKRVRTVTDKLPNPRAQRYLERLGYTTIDAQTSGNKAALVSGLNIPNQAPLYRKARDSYSARLNTGNDYNATGQGPSQDRDDLENIQITNSTIQQVIEMQKNGKLIGAGRFQFDAEDLLQAAELTGISLQEKFSPTIQNKLFDAYYKQNGPDMEKRNTELGIIHDRTEAEKHYHKALTDKALYNLDGYYRPGMLELQRGLGVGV